MGFTIQRIDLLLERRHVVRAAVQLGAHLTHERRHCYRLLDLSIGCAGSLGPHRMGVYAVHAGDLRRDTEPDQLLRLLSRSPLGFMMARISSQDADMSEGGVMSFKNCGASCA